MQHRSDQTMKKRREEKAAHFTIYGKIHGKKNLISQYYKQSSVRKRHLLLAADSMPGKGKIDQMGAL